MLNGHPYTQPGMTLIEVLVALLILAIGLLGAASVQLNALKHTDSALRHSHTSFIIYDLLDRIRANPEANYALASLAAAPASGNLAVPRDQDLFDFASNLTAVSGTDTEAQITSTAGAVEVRVRWNDARAAGADRWQTLTLNTQVASVLQVSP